MSARFEARSKGRPCQLVVASFSAAGFQSAGEETILKMATWQAMASAVDRGRRPLSIGRVCGGVAKAKQGALEALCRAIIYCCIVSRMCSYPSRGPTFAAVLPFKLRSPLPSPLAPKMKIYRELFGLLLLLLLFLLFRVSFRTSGAMTRSLLLPFWGIGSLSW